jgi:hypothetical protein
MTNRKKMQSHKVKLTNNDASHQLVPQVLQGRSYYKHPEPDVAADSVVVHKFNPQVCTITLMPLRSLGINEAMACANGRATFVRSTHGA